MTIIARSLYKVVFNMSYGQHYDKLLVATN